MSTNRIDILVTFDKRYFGPFQTMLTSLVMNNPDEKVHVWLLHSEIPDGKLWELERYCNRLAVGFTPLQVARALFREAPVSDRYPQEMYYRLLAPQLLPASLGKVLYLDPDILVINPLTPLWNTDLGKCTFAAASHTEVTNVANNVNRIRLGTDHDYYNSGVILMDLEKARTLIDADAIFDYVRKYEIELILPDQDVFNALYGACTKKVPDALWNYDVRDYSAYLLTSLGIYDMDWVIFNTSILHFCGKKKPWNTTYPSRFNALYKHYMHLANRVSNQ